MDRRSFLKQISLYTAGLCLSPPVFHILPGAECAERATPDIFVAKGQNYLELVDRILEAAGGMKAFVRPSDRVVVKPNIGWDRTIEQAANTHPQVVSRIVEHCLDAGVQRVLIFDRTCNEERMCYNRSGIRDAVKAIKDKRVKLEYVDDRKFIPVVVKNGQLLKKWSFYRDALEADAYINVPVAKHHGSSGLSIGLKNIMGAIGGWRGRLHVGLSQKIADLNQVIAPTLTIADATRVIVRNGPQGGDLEDVRVLDTVVASTDTVAVDAYATTLFGLSPDAIGSTVAAYKLGLGQMDLDKCRIRELDA